MRALLAGCAIGAVLAAANVYIGLKTGFVARPTEYGRHQTRDLEAEHDFDVVARDFVHLAELMGA